jgi:trans-2,3-dihydro-3-hydroxyanthranilate isomerase
VANTRSYRYLHLDVFTGHVLSGNQLAVFPDAQSLDTETMQAIALEMAFSETTFVLPAEIPECDFRVRIFTPRSELPMAGHPTIGTTFALAHEDRIRSGQPDICLHLGVGPTPVALEWNSSGLRFAWMTQQSPEFWPVVLKESALMALALGIPEREIRDTKLPIQIVSCGVPFLFVPLMSREAVNAAELERGALLKFCAASGLDELPVFVFSIERSDNKPNMFSKMFAPGFGVPEDPATGGASGPLGCYLVQHRAVTAAEAKDMTSLQGVKIGRPSKIYISISVSGGRIDSVRVGGQAVLVGEGTIRI